MNIGQQKNCIAIKITKKLFLKVRVTSQKKMKIETRENLHNSQEL